MFAAAPIVDASSLNMDVVYAASRYDKGDPDYLNCPMTREQYDAFYTELITAREAELHDFDREMQKELKVFEGCMPVEIMAKRGYDTLRYGPLKPGDLSIRDRVRRRMRWYSSARRTPRVLCITS